MNRPQACRGAALVVGAVMVTLCRPASANAQGSEKSRLLAGLRDSVCFAETFDGADSARFGAATDGVAGRAVANGGNVAFATSNILSRATGTISWWSRMNFDTAYGSILLTFDDGGTFYANFIGAKGANDPRHAELFYWNGKRVGQVGVTYPLSTLPLARFTLGNQWPGKDKREYQFDELRVYNRCLTEAELMAYVEAIRAGGERARQALESPAVPARRDVVGLRAGYRISDHAVQIFSDLSTANVKIGAPVEVRVENPDGREMVKQTVSCTHTGRLFHASLPVKRPLADGDYRVVLTAPRADKGPAVGTAMFNRCKEEWEGNPIGGTDKVMDPWAPMTCRRNTAQCWGRDYTFGLLGLPEQILSTQPEPCWGPATKPLLAMPVSVVVETPGGALAWNP